MLSYTLYQLCILLLFIHATNSNMFKSTKLDPKTIELTKNMIKITKDYMVEAGIALRIDIDKIDIPNKSFKLVEAKCLTKAMKDEIQGTAEYFINHFPVHTTNHDVSFLQQMLQLLRVLRGLNKNVKKTNKSL